MNWEIITAVASSIIALCALALSIWQGMQARKHSRISFRPHLTTWVHNEHEKGKYVIELLNNGLGPALIENFTIKVDGKIISGEGTEPIEKALAILFPNEQFNAHYAYLGKKHAMGAKDKCIFIMIQFCGENLPSSEYVEHKMNRGDLEVGYDSFYGEKFIFNTANERPKKLNTPKMKTASI